MKYWLWLANLRQVSNLCRLTLLSHFGTPENIYYAGEEELALAGMNRRAVEALMDKSLDTAERVMESCQRLGLRVLTIRDTEYPDRLRNIYDPPVLLYLQGRMPLFDEEAAVAMVGTRKCTPYGVAAAEKLSYTMAAQGALIVSGLAEGIDAAAHRGALRAGGVTVAVIAGGHDLPYPACNRYLYADIAASGGILSEYPPGTEHSGRHFPVRNRILSGLSLAVVVVEAPMRSGALITAHAALEQGRDVFAVPGPIDAPMSAGTIQLLREGAGPVADSWDVLGHYADQYPARIRPRTVAAPPPLMEEHREESLAPEDPPAEELPLVELTAQTGLTDDQIHILQALEGRTMQVDELIEMTQIPARRVLSALTLLELEEMVRQEKGKRFALAVRLKG